MIKRFLSVLICVSFLLSASICVSDEIKIRTVVTPIGQQVEKLGTAGLMVCITNETVANGGCGTGGTIRAKDAADPANKKVDIDNTQSGTVVIFLDDGDHQFGTNDIVYDVRR
ncbi:MAG: hypothetical protein J7J51_00520 [Candidatus Omnitrophica bacterium]|nr:hypothetical protein [Candidatus Omnitrophota bacterium]